MKPKVFFTKKITPEKVVELYDALGIDLPGKVAVKVHSGEKGNQNFLHPDFWAPMVEKVQGTVVECNTAYGDAFDGVRDHTASHLKLLELHGWADAFPMDLMDAEGPDDVLPIPGGKVLKENLVGKHMKNYDSMLVLAHFKGHPMGGFGGALKQLSIGCASSRGKALIHSGGVTDSNMDTWKRHAQQDAFCEAMADAASSVVKFFEGRIALLPWTRWPSTRRVSIWSTPPRTTRASATSWIGWRAATGSIPWKPPRTWASAVGNTSWWGRKNG